MNPQGDSGSSIRVLVVYESGFIREGLCRVIEHFKGIDLVTSIYCPKDLVEVAQHLRADVILMDAQLPSEAAFEATRRMRESGAETRVVFLSVNPSFAEVRRALQVGATGFLLREAGVRELEIALHAAVEGKIFLCPTILKRLAEVVTSDELLTRGGTRSDGYKDSASIDDIITQALHLGILVQEQ